MKEDSFASAMFASLTSFDLEGTEESRCMIVESPREVSKGQIAVKIRCQMRLAGQVAESRAKFLSLLLPRHKICVICKRHMSVDGAMHLKQSKY